MLSSIAKVMQLICNYGQYVTHPLIYEFQHFSKTYVLLFFSVPASTYIHTYIVVVVLLFYVHGKHLRSCRDGQLT